MNIMDEKEKAKIEKLLVSKAGALFKKSAVITSDGFILDIRADTANESCLGVYIIKVSDKMNALLHQAIGDYVIAEYTPHTFKDCPKFNIINDDDTRASSMRDKVSCIKLINMYLNTVENEDIKWLNLSDAIDYDSVFVQNESAEIKSIDGCCSAIVSKTIFPMITKTVFKSVKYTTQSIDGLNKLVIRFPVDDSEVMLNYWFI
mgnify:CR=1 FL=1